MKLHSFKKFFNALDFDFSTSREYADAGFDCKTYPESEYFNCPEGTITSFPGESEEDVTVPRKQANQ